MQLALNGSGAMNNLKKTFIGLSIFLFISALALSDDAKQTPEIAEAQQAADKVCMAIQPHLSRPDKLKGITVVKNDEINAYADMNNKITIFSGMLDFVRDENELAVVCAHEMAHVSQQHIKRSIFTEVLATAASIAIGGTAGNIAGNALSSKESRKHEREADSTGLLYMWQAGYDPRAAWKFWLAMERKFNQGGSDIEKYFGTHPVNNERVENFKVLLVRFCKQMPELKYCNEIEADQDLLNEYNKFEGR
jgi:predicted Zn-dependent protease